MFNTKHADEFMNAFTNRSANTSDTYHNNSFSPMYNNQQLQNGWTSSNKQGTGATNAISPLATSSAFSISPLSSRNRDHADFLITTSFPKSPGCFSSPPRNISSILASRPSIDARNHTDAQISHQYSHTNHHHHHHHHHQQQHHDSQLQYNNNNQQTSASFNSTSTNSYNTDFESDGDVIMKSPLRTPRIMKHHNVQRNPFSPKIRSNAVTITLGPEFNSEAERVAHEAKMAEKRRQLEVRMNARRTAKVITTKAPEQPKKQSFSIFDDDKENTGTTKTKVVTPRKLLNRTPRVSNNQTNFFNYDMTGKSPSQFNIGSTMNKLQAAAKTNRSGLKAMTNMPHTSTANKFVTDAKSRQVSRIFPNQDQWL